MSSSPDIDTREVLRKAYLEIKALRAKLSDREGSASEPIAIVGLGCRFPGGANDAQSFWSLLHRGVDAVGTVPPDRWDTNALYDADPDAPGKLYARHGAFLEGIDRFDAAFFGISPLEASSMDPQQRMLLEIAWEALEDAGIAAGGLRGSRTGIFVGLMYQDYLARQAREGGRDSIGPYLGTGSTFSAAAGRLSYVLGLQGPSIAVDTACSSSLVAVHLACQALRSDECEMALAGGANAILSPEASINLSKARMLSPTGRCRTFDAAADGYVRGEGGGLVVLKRLSRALRDGDRILGVVRGSAVNQDGRSNGLTAPNGSAQRTLLRQALAAAGAVAEDVEYIECHGTGTPLGDPIEVGALLDVYGERSREKPLAIGSVKTNFGHLESAAGICGLIKALLVLRHREVPPHLHLTTLNPHIRLDGAPVVIPTAPTSWFTETNALAAVSAFGFVGTNAHVILGSFEAEAQAETTRRDPQLLTLSAASEPAFDALRERFIAHLESTSDDLADICSTANTGRTALAVRAAVVASDSTTMREKLREARPARIPADAPRVAFLFTGQGSHHPGAGRRLYEVEPLFCAAIDRCDAILRPHLGLPLPSLLFGEQSPLLEQTRYAQPAIVALEYALYELWTSWGVRPSIAFGHSVGDYAAAVADGTFTLDAALTIVAERGRLMQELPAGGGMAALFASEAWGREAVAPYPDTLALAAINGPTEIVLSGRLDHLRAVLDRARAEGIHARELNVSHAFHSPLMKPMLERFRTVLAGVPDAERWLDHVLAPVRFDSAIEELGRREDEILLELGPRPVLAPLACRTLTDATALHSLQPGRDDVEQMLDAAAALFTRGVPIDWSAFHAPFGGKKVALPAYPFQRERYWIQPSAVRVAPAEIPAPSHLLGTPHPQAPHQPDTFVWSVDVDRTRHPELFGHKLLGAEVWPIAAQIELALEAARALTQPANDDPEPSPLRRGEKVPKADEGLLPPVRIRDLEFKETLFASTQDVQVVVTRTSDEQADFRVYSRGDDSAPWVLNTTAIIDSGAMNRRRPLDLSMMFFAAKEDDDASDRYRLIVEAARFADRNGFRSIWVPERHFTHMGSLYPSPSVLHAALARETKHVRLMAGSVVLPLHHVPRIAEEWAMVDNLSGGRVGVSLAPGWNPDDFVLATGKYEERYEDLYAGVETLRRLWRGETFEGAAPHGRKVQLRTYPTPVQRELPLWITAARNAESFRRAGALGANVLTHLLDQDVETLAGKIALYRAARAEAGFDPESGSVTVMCHTFVAPDLETAQRLAKKPFCDYLKSSMPLLAGLAFSRGADVDVNNLSASELDEFVEFLYERFSTTRALIGTPESCRGLLDGLAAAGVNEVACLLDFGPTTDEVLEHLPLLASMCGEAAARETTVPALHVARLDRIRNDCPRALPLGDFYSTLADAGVELDASLRGVDALSVGDRQAIAQVSSAADGLALIDASLQSALAALPSGAGEPIRVPTAVRSIRVHRAPAGSMWAHGRVSRPAADGTIDGDVALFDERGELLIEIGGLHVRPLSRPAAAAGDWFYEPAWREAPWSDSAPVVPRPWIILEDFEGVGRAWAARRRGVPHLFLQRGSVTEQVGPAQWIVDPSAGFERLLRSVDVAAYEGILCLWPLDASANAALDAARLEGEQRLGVEPVIALLKAMTSSENRNVPPLWVVTRGAQAVDAGDETVNVSQSALWGLAGAVAREHRSSWGGIVDLDARAAAIQSAEDLDRALACRGAEDQVAVRNGRRLVRRLVRASAPSGHSSFPDDAAVLITGGAGGLGLSVARWMSDRGARHLILLGRTKPDELPPMAADVTWVSLDVADEAALQAFLAQRRGPPIRGVVHAAGVFRDEALRALDLETLWQVMRARVLGSWALHRAFAGNALDFFLLFSSFSALTPPAGQAAYAAASSFLDAVAHARRREGEAALSINWGAWSEVGFAATPFGREAHARLEGLGMRRLSPAEGLAALDGLLADDGLPAQVAVFPADLRKLAAADPVLEHRPLLRELVGTPAVSMPQPAAALLHIRRMSAAGQQAYLREQVGRVVSEVLQIKRTALDVRTPLTQLGLDSLIAVQLKNRIEKEVGLPVPLTSALRGASVLGMVDELMVELRLDAMNAGPTEEADARQELEL